MTTQLANTIKYADLQLAAEAFFIGKTLGAGLVRNAEINGGSEIDKADLIRGNTRTSLFTTESAAQFAADWEIVEHIANTGTGFSGTLFKARNTDAARGITAGELVLSFRSTEFLDDAARDNQATNTMKIKPYGWAFGQVADMENWYLRKGVGSFI
jgi:hypothetical protein